MKRFGVTVGVLWATLAACGNSSSVEVDAGNGTPKARLVSTDAQEIRTAEWESYQRLAKLLPDHHVLSVQMIRTRSNETAAIFTTVEDGQPVRSVLMGDARGQAYPLATSRGGSSGDSGEVTADGIALGQPPVQQPITPGQIELGTKLLAAAFDVDGTSAP